MSLQAGCAALVQEDDNRSTRPLGIAVQTGRGKAWAEAFFQRKGKATDGDADDEPTDGRDAPADA